MLFGNFFAVTALLGSVKAAPYGLTTGRGVSELGTLTVESKCASNAFLWVVAPPPSGQGPMETVAPGSAWDQQFQITASGGISVKISEIPDLGSGTPLQMEYTVDLDSSKIFYDMSAINGNGGLGSNWVLTPETMPDPGNPTCVTVTSSNDYHNPGERDNATMVCTTGNSVTLTLC